MIPVVGVYDDVRFRVNKENGFVTASEFNNACWLAQLSFLDWLTGGSTGVEIPSQFISHKNRDWLSVFIKKFPVNVGGGVITKPSDYYLFDTLYKLNQKVNITDDQKKGKNKSIDLLSSDKFEERCNTSIEELVPAYEAPIAKMVGSLIEFEPKDIGNVVLQYIRYPAKSKLVMTVDEEFNDEVPDVEASDNFEWGEYARKPLIWFIVDEMSNHTREQALKQFNSASADKGGKG